MNVSQSGSTAAERARLLHALALNRKARLNFPGMFMGLYGRQTGATDIELEFADDALFRAGSGEVSWAALAVLVDVALGSVTRLEAGPSLRPATVHLILQMTGEPMREHLVAHAHSGGVSTASALPQSLPRATVTSAGKLVAHASGAFVLLPLPRGETQVVLPWVPEEIEAAPLAASELDEDEREVLKSFDRARRVATSERPFIEHFWCGIPKVQEGKAQLSARVTPHIGNRVRHVHGGVLVGAAAQVASAAVPSGMRLSNISAWFVNPGQPPRVKVRSEVLQQSRNFALVRTRITGATGKLVLEATSQHIASA
jgi:acyl-coenzyme A thioesterase PaaI-like protein